MSNLLDKASILLTPTAYSDGTLHSVKPVQTFGSELVTNGDFATDSNWAVNAGWSISDGKANIDTDNGTDIFSQSSVLVVGKKYKLSLIANVTVGSIKFESGEGDNLVFTSDIDSHIFIADRTQVVFRRQVTPTRGYIDNVSIVEVIDGDFDFTRATTATRVNSSGLIESVASGLPRIDFLGGTGQILLEQASTNLVTNSDPASLSDIPSTIGITVETFTWPIGFLQNAIRFPGGNNTATNRQGEMATGVDMTVSCFVIMDDGSEPKVGGSATESGVNQDFSLRVNNVNVDKDTVKVVNLGNNVYRVSGLVTAARNSSTQVNSGVVQNSNYSGKAFRVGGMQIEQQSFATSYIPTSGSTVTRNKEEANSSGDTSLINSTEGVIYAELRMLERTSDDFSKPVSIGDGTTSGQNNSVFIVRLASQEDQFGGSIRNPDGSSAFFSFTVTNSNEFFKFALQYKSSENKMFVNGTQIGTTNGLTINLNTLDRLNLSNSVGNEPAEARIKCVAVFKEALTDAELIALTS